jgi:hypothetical protein
MASNALTLATTSTFIIFNHFIRTSQISRWGVRDSCFVFKRFCVETLAWEQEIPTSVFILYHHFRNFLSSILKYATIFQFKFIIRTFPIIERYVTHRVEKASLNNGSLKISSYKHYPSLFCACVLQSYANFGCLEEQLKTDKMVIEDTRKSEKEVPVVFFISVRSFLTSGIVGATS